MKKIGTVISISSSKGGVGKTVLTTCLAGIYSNMNKHVLLVDLDLYSGGIAVLLNTKNSKDIFNLIDDLTNNRFTDFKDYIVSYNNMIDVLCAPRDPRQATKVSERYIDLILEKARKVYDVILIDTTHILDAVTLMALDRSDMSLHIVTNDPVDLKNTKSMMAIYKDTEKVNFRVLLNLARDTGRDYLTPFDIKNVIKHNLDYTLNNTFYIKQIDKYILDGSILSLNKKIVRTHHRDMNKLQMIASDLINESEMVGHE